VSYGALVLVVQDGGHVAQTGTRLNDSDLRTGRHAHAVHAIELDNQVAILAAEAERSIAVAARLGGDLDTEVLTAYHRILDMLDRSGHGDGDGRVGHADVEGRRVARPALAALDVDGDAGLGQARLDGLARDDDPGLGRQRGQERESHGRREMHVCRSHAGI
jgi:hypothetical protein